MIAPSTKLTIVITSALLLTFITLVINAFALQRIQSTPLIVAAALLGLLWVAVTTYALGLIDSRFSAIFLFFGMPAILVIISFGELSAFGAAIILGIALFAAHDKTQNELVSRKEYQPWRAFAAGSQLVLVGLIVSLAGLSLPVIADELSETNFEIPADTVAVFLQPLAGVINSWFPGYTPHTPISRLLYNQIAATQPGFTPSDADVDLLLRDLSQRFNLDIGPTDTLPQVISLSLNQNLTSVVNTHPVLSAVAFVVSLVLLVRIFVPILAAFARLVVLLIDYLARHSGFVVITTKSELVDVFSL